MSTTTANYSKGSLLQEMNFAGLVRNTVVDGIVLEGQSSHAWMKLIEGTNAKWEQNGGTGNKMLPIYKSEVAYTGDPTIYAQIQTATSLGGGRIKITFTDSQEGFRKDDGVATGFSGVNVAKVIEASSTYIVVGAMDGYEAPQTTDFPAAKNLIQYYRSIGIRGTKSPVGINIIPDTWENYLSIMDDAVQQNIFDNQNQTVLQYGQDYIKMAPVSTMMERFFQNQVFQQFMSRGVDPSKNGFTRTSTKGIHQQLQERGYYFPQLTQLTRAEFEQRLRTKLLANPSNPIDNTVILTGSLGHAQVSEWYKDEIKYSDTLVDAYVDGVKMNGINTVKIFLPGFGPIKIAKWSMLDMNKMGAKTSIAGFTDLPKTSGSFYILDFTPAQIQGGATAPAFRKTYFGGAKYFYSLQQGLVSVDSIQSIVSNATPVTEANLQATSTDADFTNMRVYSICGIDVMNPTAHAWIDNLV